MHRDSEYAKAYLRRARAFNGSNSFNAAIRDFRRYLSTIPAPHDTLQVTTELENTIRENYKGQRETQQRREWEERTAEQRRVWTAAGQPASQNYQTGPGFGGVGGSKPYSTSTAGDKGIWTSEDEAKFNFYKVCMCGRNNMGVSDFIVNSSIC